MEPKLQDFVRAARRSLATGADIELDRSEHPQATGGRWGRVIGWIRNRIFPNRRRAANLRVLHKLESTLRKEFPEISRGRLRAGARRVSHLPLARRILVTASGVRAAATYREGSTLDEEIREALRLGHASRVFRVSKDAAIPEREFTRIVQEYNRTMSDLHGRFPKLRRVPPPALTQREADDPLAYALYSRGAQTIRFRNASIEEWTETLARGIARGWMTPKAPGLQGGIAHEYGHHLSDVAAARPWFPELVRVLKGNGVPIASTARLPGNGEFSRAVKGHLPAMGLGRYAGVNPREFVAEALAWYMSPTYGQPLESRMPAYLENWLRDCFPCLSAAAKP